MYKCWVLALSQALTRSVKVQLTVRVNACPGNYKHALVITVRLGLNRPTSKQLFIWLVLETCCLQGFDMSHFKVLNTKKFSWFEM